MILDTITFRLVLALAFRLEDGAKTHDEGFCDRLNRVLQKLIEESGIAISKDGVCRLNVDFQ